ncbi:hypothetical protein LEP1GSC161_1306 [Leptospira santarosai str. CBC1416]|uniref:Uncharacterized protein n=1 Tax=Leptospira santarosai str. CBC1416 TaxID=1193059 RepID=M6VFJ7_9LEPT|nr:hypothetical protein LEP1GSC076_1457 [Leptospira sp. Fiocruz LV4135]EMO56267.1 hypothetical protein LEP1GSC161_1306 [Leptospira santarosai str. CBC1416]
MIPDTAWRSEIFTLMEYCSELYNRVSKILLQNGDWTQNEWYPIL